MSYHLGFNTHGKGRVRLVKVTRNKDGTHEIMQLSVQILLEGEKEMHEERCKTDALSYKKIFLCDR